MSDESSGEGLMELQCTKRRLALATLILAAIPRCVFFIASSGDPSTRQVEHDSIGYLTLARNLSLGLGFAREVELDSGRPAVWLPELFRTPGYPMFIAGLTRLFGNGQLATIVLQNLLGAAICVTAVTYVFRSFGRRAALVTSALLALDIQGAALANLILTEVLYGVLLFIAVLLTAKWADNPRWERIITAGACVGLSALVRPTSLLLGIVMAAGLVVFALWRRQRRALIGALLFAIVANGIIAVWIIRNGIICGDLTFTSLGRAKLMETFATDALSRAEDISRVEALRRVAAKTQLTYPYVCAQPLTQQEKSRINKVVLQIIRDNPRAFAVEWVVNTATMLFAPDKLFCLTMGARQPDFSFMHHGPKDSNGLAGVSCVTWSIWGAQIPYIMTVWLLVAFSIHKAIKHRRMVPVVWLSLAIVIYVLGLSGGSPGDERYRSAVLPLMIVLGVSGLAEHTSAGRSGASRTANSKVTSRMSQSM